MLYLLLIVAVIIITWNVGVSLTAKLRTSRDGFIFRTKYSEDFRSIDRQEEIDAMAFRLQHTERTDRRPNSEES
jgi:hypothetical protein